MNQPETLVRLIYCSDKHRYVDGAALKELLATAQSNNAANDVTGVLLFNSGYFLQALEGTRAQVNKLFQIIVSDKRHDNVQIIELVDINQRHWSKWSMQLVSITEKEEQIYYKYSNQDKFNPYSLNSDDAFLFLAEIANVEKLIKS